MGITVILQLKTQQNKTKTKTEKEQGGIDAIAKGCELNDFVVH